MYIQSLISSVGASPCERPAKPWLTSDPQKISNLLNAVGRRESRFRAYSILLLMLSAPMATNLIAALESTLWGKGKGDFFVVAFAVS